MKKFAKVLRNPPSRQKNSSRIFADRFIDKDGGLRTHNPSAEEVRGLEVFFC
jgi:hypothetical protein